MKYGILEYDILKYWNMEILIYETLFSERSEEKGTYRTIAIPFGQLYCMTSNCWCPYAVPFGMAFFGTIMAFFGTITFIVNP